MTYVEKLIKSHGYVHDTSKRSKGKCKLSIEITRLKNFYHICYHPSHLIANGRVINSKGNTKFSQYYPKNLPLFPKAWFGLSKNL